MSSRRIFLKTAAGRIAAFSTGVLASRNGWPSDMLLGPDTLPAGALDSAVLSALPGKQPLIKRTYRPPNYETPPAALKHPFTPNSSFFVRYHLSSIPAVDAAAWRLRIGGDAVGTPLEYTLAELQRRFEVVELPAVCQCAGNRRGLFQPHVPGIQWGHGAMGNALWKGVRLRDVLSQAHLKKDALEVTFDGADTGVLEKTPDFVKSLPLAKALDDHTLIAFAMNGEPLPHWNGFPARLVVPGWTATYWVKHLNAIDVVSKAFDGFWMKTAYRLPNGLFAEGGRFLSQQTETSTPITELLVNSLITHPTDGQRFVHSDVIDISGVAWDAGHGISRVEISTDGGRSWDLGALGKDYGPYAWRPWVYRFAPPRSGAFAVKVRATNRSGSTQGTTAIENPAGYHHNAIQTITIHRV